MQMRFSTEVRQAEIVATALRLARESSPALITTGDIATAIGITQGAVFKHFPTKDAIWLATMRWVRETLLQALQAAADQAASPLDALAAMFRAHVEFVIAHPGVPRFIFHELQQPADSAAKLEVRAVLQGYRKLLLGRLNESIELKLVSPDLDPEAAATSFIGLIQGLVMQSMLTGRAVAMRQQADAIFALYRRGLGEAP
ncbi:MAG: TetR/AcrR family transcriptional regulator [Rubrivivax sp.]|nr:TetR/AcrR family transcriptional regulator [Rubrivivax sp.]